LVRSFAGSDYNRLAESGQALKSFKGAPVIDGAPFVLSGAGPSSVLVPLKETILHKCHLVASKDDVRFLQESEPDDVGALCPSCREPLVLSPVAVDPSPRLCGRYMSVATCRNHHVFFKVLVCGQEWCPVCGEDDSLAHRRRISAFLPKAQQLSSMGYLVVQASCGRRNWLRRGAYRKWYFAVVKRVLKQFGIDEALWFWHLFGELRGGSFNPHLNILFEGGLVPLFFINELREALRSELRDSALVVNYGFHEKSGQKYSVLKYCVRSTFRSESWDCELAAGLYGERRRGSFGKWAGKPVWEVESAAKCTEAVEQLEAGLCPRCGEALTWHSKVVSTNFLDIWETADLGDGFRSLADGGGEVRRGRVRLVR